MDNENDMIIKLRGAILADGSPYITVNYPAWDTDLGLLSGSTKQYLSRAAEIAGYGIQLEGETSAVLERGRTQSLLQRS